MPFACGATLPFPLQIVESRFSTKILLFNNLGSMTSATKDNRIIQSYLFFNGRCEEALEFYRKALGAEIDLLMRFKDSPEPPKPGMVPPGFENKVMHASFRIGQSTLMASDGCSGEKPAFEGFSLSISVASEAQADQYFNALADDGQVKMPMAKAFWSPRFGMVEDRFGIGWMISVTPTEHK
ncbi:MAG: 3-demethylubiquinone-9 3-methyltransferase [Verrucomicrobiales bacterium]|nr:3-demethylubiquinone-9 3-methyltransferase [Verrucomicrobiales bacterium]